jgi:ribosomal protein S18 acetylase RimI-like enzyme
LHACFGSRRYIQQSPVHDGTTGYDFLLELNELVLPWVEPSKLVAVIEMAPDFENAKRNIGRIVHSYCICIPIQLPMALPAPIVRAAKAEDAAAIAKIGREVFTATFAHTVSHSNLAAYLDSKYTAAAVLADLTDVDSRFFVSESDAIVSGFLQLKLSSSALEPCIADKPKPVELARIYVDNAHHGGGVAKALLTHSEGFSRDQGYETIWLGVLPENSRAVRFYEKAGFERVGEHTFMVGDQMDTDAIMVKTLIYG